MTVARRLKPGRVWFVASGTPWFDYIPVKIEGSSKDAFDAAGYVEVVNVTGSSGLTAWNDYTPVKLVTSGTPWRYDADGYIPIQLKADEGWGSATYALDLAGTASLTPVVGSVAPTVTRAGNTATRVNSSGVIEVVNANLPRFDYDPVTLACKGLLVEGARTNMVLNSDTLATQSVTVTNVPHTLSFYGTGTVTRSGVSSGETVGTGAYPTRTTVTFTPTAGSLTLTVTGSVTFAQLEIGGYASSYIPTAGAAVTRNADVVALAIADLPGYNTTQGSLFVDMTRPDDNDDWRVAGLGFDDGTGAGDYLSAIYAGLTGAAVESQDSPGFSGVYIYPTPALTRTNHVVAGAWNAASTDMAVAGESNTAVGIAPSTTLTRLCVGSIRGNIFLDGHVRQAAYWPTKLSTTRLEGLTA